MTRTDGTGFLPQLIRSLLVPLSQLQAAVKLLLEVMIADLVQDVGVSGLVNLERLVALLQTILCMVLRR
jgi:hypothetical protein